MQPFLPSLTLRPVLISKGTSISRAPMVARRPGENFDEKKLSWIPKYLGNHPQTYVDV